MRILVALPGVHGVPEGAKQGPWGDVQPPDALDGRLARFTVPALLAKAHPGAICLVRQTFSAKRCSWRKYPDLGLRETDPELSPGVETCRESGSRPRECWWLMREEKTADVAP